MFERIGIVVIRLTVVRVVSVYTRRLSIVIGTEVQHLSGTVYIDSFSNSLV